MTLLSETVFLSWVRDDENYDNYYSLLSLPWLSLEVNTINANGNSGKRQIMWFHWYENSFDLMGSLKGSQGTFFGNTEVENSCSKPKQE